jgi:hypothetical protein
MSIVTKGEARYAQLAHRKGSPATACRDGMYRCLHVHLVHWWKSSLSRFPYPCLRHAVLRQIRNAPYRSTISEFSNLVASVVVDMADRIGGISFARMEIAGKSETLKLFVISEAEN